MKMPKKWGRNKGFTAIELVFVLAILVILISITAPHYVKYVEQAQMSADAAALSDLATALKVATVDADYGVEEGRYIFTLTAKGLILESYQGTTNLVMNASRRAGLEKAFTDFCGGEWKADGETVNPIVKLHYKKWTDDVYAQQKVQMICQVDGRKVSVSYQPETLETYMAEAKAGHS